MHESSRSSIIDDRVNPDYLKDKLEASQSLELKFAQQQQKMTNLRKSTARDEEIGSSEISEEQN